MLPIRWCVVFIHMIIELIYPVRILRLSLSIHLVEMSVTWLDICLGALGLFFVQRILSKKPLGRLPPGPKKWPLLGNILDMPTSKEWLTFIEWGRTYGNC